MKKLLFLLLSVCSSITFASNTCPTLDTFKQDNVGVWHISKLLPTLPAGLEWSNLWQDLENGKDYHEITTIGVILSDNSITCDYGPYNSFWDMLSVGFYAPGIHVAPAPGSHFDQSNQCFSKDPSKCAFVMTK